MKNKTLIIAAVALVAVIGIFLGIYFATRPSPDRPPKNLIKVDNQTDNQTGEQIGAGEKTFTLIVVHADGSEKTFTCHTDADYLAEALLETKLAEGGEGPFGLDISHIDGEKAVYAEDKAYWALYIGEEYATTGPSSTPVYNGSVFKYVYTPA